MIQPKNDTLSLSGGAVLDKAEYHIDQSAMTHIISMLQGMYSEPVKAVLREYVANALDVHVQTGKIDVPIDIHMPSYAEPYLVVRDYGTGLSLDETKQLIFGIGASGANKRLTNDAIGGFGIGCKCAFAVTDSFLYTIWHGGLVRTWDCHKNEKGVSISKMIHEAESDEPTGIQVNIPLPDFRVGDFQNYVSEIFTYLPGKYNFSNTADVQPPESVLDEFLTEAVHTIAVETDDKVTSEFEIFIRLRKKNASKTNQHEGTGIALVMGGIYYEIDTQMFGGEYKLKNDLVKLAKAAGFPSERIVSTLTNRFIIYVPNGTVSLTPSRERIMYTPYTMKMLQSIFNMLYSKELLSQLLAKFNEGVSSGFNTRERLALAKELCVTREEPNVCFSNAHDPFNGNVNFVIPKESLPKGLLKATVVDVDSNSMGSVKLKPIVKAEVYNYKTRPEFNTYVVESQWYDGLNNSDRSRMGVQQKYFVKVTTEQIGPRGFTRENVDQLIRACVLHIRALNAASGLPNYYRTTTTIHLLIDFADDVEWLKDGSFATFDAADALPYLNDSKIDTLFTKASIKTKNKESRERRKAQKAAAAACATTQTAPAKCRCYTNKAFRKLMLITQATPGELTNTVWNDITVADEKHITDAPTSKCVYFTRYRNKLLYAGYDYFKEGKVNTINSTEIGYYVLFSCFTENKTVAKALFPDLFRGDEFVCFAYNAAGTDTLNGIQTELGDQFIPFHRYIEQQIQLFFKTYNVTDFLYGMVLSTWEKAAASIPKSYPLAVYLPLSPFTEGGRATTLLNKHEKSQGINEAWENIAKAYPLMGSTNPADFSLTSIFLEWVPENFPRSATAAVAKKLKALKHGYDNSKEANFIALLISEMSGSRKLPYDERFLQENKSEVSRIYPQGRAILLEPRKQYGSLPVEELQTALQWFNLTQDSNITYGIVGNKPKGVARDINMWLKHPVNDFCFDVLRYPILASGDKTQMNLLEQMVYHAALEFPLLVSLSQVKQYIRVIWDTHSNNPCVDKKRKVQIVFESEAALNLRTQLQPYSSLLMFPYEDNATLLAKVNKGKTRDDADMFTVDPNILAQPHIIPLILSPGMILLTKETKKQKKQESN